MTSLELLQEIDAWLSFNNSPSKEQISELRNDIKKHISEQLNILHIVQQSEQFGDVSEKEELPNNDKPDWNGNCWNQI